MPGVLQSSCGGSTEDLETEVGQTVGHSRNFTLSPETTDCDSNCDSEVHVCPIPLLGYNCEAWYKLNKDLIKRKRRYLVRILYNYETTYSFILCI